MNIEALVIAVREEIGRQFPELQDEWGERVLQADVHPSATAPGQWTAHLGGLVEVYTEGGIPGCYAVGSFDDWLEIGERLERRGFPGVYAEFYNGGVIGFYCAPKWPAAEDPHR